jgi:Rap1a immunity proteins
MPRIAGIVPGIGQSLGPLSVSMLLTGHRQGVCGVGSISTGEGAPLKSIRHRDITPSMRIGLAFLLAVGALSVSPRASALSEVNGLMLLHQCQVSVRISNEDTRVSPDQVAESNHCLGYVQGVLDANGFWDTIDKRDDHSSRARYCMSESVTFEQVIRIIVKWLDANPKELNDNGYIAVQVALVKTFPCKARQ